MPTCRQRPDERPSFHSSILIIVVHQVRGELARLSPVALEECTQASRVSNISPDVSARPLDLHPEKIVELLVACAFLADKRDATAASSLSSPPPSHGRRRRNGGGDGDFHCHSMRLKDGPTGPNPFGSGYTQESPAALAAATVELGGGT